MAHGAIREDVWQNGIRAAQALAALLVYLVGSAGIGLGIGLWLFVTGHLRMGWLS